MQNAAKHLNWIFANIVNIKTWNISYDLTSCNYDDKNIKFWLQHRNILTPFQWVCHTEASQVGDDSLTNHHRVVSHVTQSNLECQRSHIYIRINLIHK